MSADDLIERIWGPAPPPAATSNLQALVSRLRKRLHLPGDTGAHLDDYIHPGYQLRVLDQDRCVDVHQHRALLRNAARARRDHDSQQALTLFREAEALWAEPLGGLRGDWAEQARAELRERHQQAVLARAETEIDLGEHPDLGQLRSLVADDPLNQPAARVLMLGLHAAGRRDEAAAVFRELRTRLDTEQGIEPNRELASLHTAILTDDPTLAPAGPPPTAPTRARIDILEPDVELVGRDEEHREIIETVNRAHTSHRVTVISIDGAPGVGKTSLAVRVGHQLKERCDTALQLCMNAHAPAPETDATVALPLLLGMLQVEARELTRATNLQVASALWRTHTAGIRVLLVLDDVRDYEQIRPLIPAGSGSIVLLTSRARLELPPEVTGHTVSTLSPDRALLVLRYAAGRELHPDAPGVHELLEWCGGLPLALVVLGGVLRAHPQWRPSDIANRLASSGLADPMTVAVTAAFEASYDTLPSRAQLLYRRLGLHPHPGGITTPAAAALAGLDLDAADQTLELLTSRRLLGEVERHRYRMHDLLYAYARQRVEEEDDEATREEATSRLFGFYVSATSHAATVFAPHGPSRPTGVSVVTSLTLPTLPDEAAAGAWLDAESPTLLALICSGARTPWRRSAALLTGLITGYLDRRALWRQAIELHESALGIWVALANQSAQAATLNSLAAAHWRIAELDEAATCSETALAVWRELGDEGGQAEAHFQLARVEWRRRNPAAAIRGFRTAGRLYARIGDRAGQARCAYHLGTVQFQAGDHEAALSQLTQALSVARQIRDDSLICHCLANLGSAAFERGDHKAALDYSRQAAATAARLGLTATSATMWTTIGQALNHLGRPAAALDWLQPAATTLAKCGDQHTEIIAHLGLADVYHNLGQGRRAAIPIQRATVLSDRLGDPLLQAQVALTGARHYRELNDFTAAEMSYREALRHAREANAPLELAHGHKGLGDLLEITRGPRAAREHWQIALEYYARLALGDADEMRARIARVAATGA